MIIITFYYVYLKLILNNIDYLPIDCLLCNGALPNCAGVGARTNGLSSTSFLTISS